MWSISIKCLQRGAREPLLVHAKLDQAHQECVAKVVSPHLPSAGRGGEGAAGDGDTPSANKPARKTD